MENKVFAFVLLLLVCGFVSAWEIEDINGTYVYDKELLKSPDVRNWQYTWGRGLRITETSLEFDLKKKEIMMPGLGLYLIDTVAKDDRGSVRLRVFSVGDKDHENPIDMKVTFIDSSRVYIECSEWEWWHDQRYSPDAKWVWYRLSGPKKSSS